ncbi:MAG: NAD(+)/NADH kinase, partial [Candidatus Sumerlaeia bacterium]|nr:NAD(+)/NADH kinase [Candidatus Sumerlaeia bacterium]
MKSLIGIVVNTTKPAALKLSEQIISWLERRKLEVLIEEKTAEKLSSRFKHHPSAPLAKMGEVDILLTLGGDGFLLHCARELYPCHCTLLPVNLGSLGFNAQVNANEVFDAIESALAGKLKIQRRLMLKGEIWREGKSVASGFALNEILLTKTTGSRIINVQLQIDGVIAGKYYGDGVMVSTPTGSTAYNLAAGEPIVHPDTNAVIITALCQHSLTQRTLILPATLEIELIFRPVKDREEAIVIFDGQRSVALQGTEIVKIRRARE